MSETLIASLISAGSAIIVCVITQLISAKKTEALVVYRIDQLEKKVDRHNSLVDRTYRLEERAEVHEVQLHAATHRLDDLERQRAAGGN